MEAEQTRVWCLERSSTVGLPGPIWKHQTLAEESKKCIVRKNGQRPWGHSWKRRQIQLRVPRRQRRGQGLTLRGQPVSKERTW